MGFGEFEEYMATEVSHEDLEEAAKKEEEYKNEIAKSKVPIFYLLYRNKTLVKLTMVTVK